MNVGKKYRFSIYGSINGVSNFEGIIASNPLGTYLDPKANGHVNHANIYPALPEEVKVLYPNDNYTSYNYYMLVTDAGNTYYIGEPWINSATIEELTQKIKVIEVIDPDGRSNSELVSLLESRNYSVRTVNEKDIV